MMSKIQLSCPRTVSFTCCSAGASVPRYLAIRSSSDFETVMAFSSPFLARLPSAASQVSSRTSDSSRACSLVSREAPRLWSSSARMLCTSLFDVFQPPRRRRSSMARIESPSTRRSMMRFFRAARRRPFALVAHFVRRVEPRFRGGRRPDWVCPPGGVSGCSGILIHLTRAPAVWPDRAVSCRPIATRRQFPHVVERNELATCSGRFGWAIGSPQSVLVPLSRCAFKTPRASEAAARRSSSPAARPLRRCPS